MAENTDSAETVLSVASGDTKADIRTKVWEYLENNNLTSFPRPVTNRIPNFKSSGASCDKVTDLEVFKNANTVKVNPDKPQEVARFKTLENNKTLLVPTPRLRRGLFNKIQPPDARKGTLRFCCTSQGVKMYSKPLGLDMKIKVDLVIAGSVAVSTKGLRIGKGEGFADLEYAMMSTIGAVDENTVIVTCVHDSQVMDLPEDLFESHDITVDYICTPTRIIECSHRPKPTGIIWSMLSLEKFLQIPILKVLRDQEEADGKDVTLKDATEDELLEALSKLTDEEADQESERPRGGGDQRRRNRTNRYGNRGGRGKDGEGNQPVMNGVSSGAEGGEHADGEESPSGERRRYNNNRRRRMRNRRRNPDSERQNSEGDRMSPLPHNEDEEERGEKGGSQRRRRPRRFRRPRDYKNSENQSGTEENEENAQNVDGKASPEGRYDNRRRGAPRRFRNRQRNRSEGDQNEDTKDQDQRPRGRGGPRRFGGGGGGYQNRRSYRDDRRNEDHSADSREGGSPGGDDRRRPRSERPRRNNNLPTLYVGSLPKALRVSAFKKQVRDMDVNPLRVLWRGSNGHVFLIFETMEETESALIKLENLCVNEKEVKVAMANRTERRRRDNEGREEGGEEGGIKGSGNETVYFDAISDQVKNLSLDSKSTSGTPASESVTQHTISEEDSKASVAVET